MAELCWGARGGGDVSQGQVCVMGEGAGQAPWKTGSCVCTEVHQTPTAPTVGLNWVIIFFLIPHPDARDSSFTRVFQREETVSIKDPRPKSEGGGP